MRQASSMSERREARTFMPDAVVLPCCGSTLLFCCSGGKTQLCMQLACNVQIPKRLQGSCEGEAIYIGEAEKQSARRLCAGGL